MHAALDFPQLDRLNRRAITARRMREQAVDFAMAAHIVEAHWYELPYEIRSKLEEQVEKYESEPSRRPQSALDWVRFVVAAGEMVWTAIMGDEDFVVHHAFARARFGIALKERLEREKAADANVWREATKDDPGFLAAFQRGTAAAKAGGFVAMDWATPPNSK